MQVTDYKTGLAWFDLTQNGPLNGKYTCLKLTQLKRHVTSLQFKLSPLKFLPLASVIQSTGLVLCNISTHRARR